MIFTSNNWYKWYYGSSEAFARSNKEQLQTTYGSYRGRIPSLKEALLENARSTADHYPGEKFELLFSGGVDSEVALRAYAEIGVPIRANIFRYENNYNIYDVSFAVVICEQLGVDYRIIDFNLEQFYENDAERISEQAQSCRPRAIVNLGFVDKLDGFPICASSDLGWTRPHSDYSMKAEWRAVDFEYDIALDRYNEFHGRPAIMQWFKWTPQMVLGWTNTNWFKSLVNDEIFGKLGVNSTKLQGYREAYPDLIARAKKTGFEQTDHIVLPFEKFLGQKYGGLPYRQQTDRSINDLWIEMRGEPYDSLHYP
jgi:hypothetical protein